MDWVADEMLLRNARLNSPGQAISEFRTSIRENSRYILF